MHCEQCGTQVREGARFCSGCGRSAASETDKQRQFENLAAETGSPTSRPKVDFTLGTVMFCAVGLTLVDVLKSVALDGTTNGAAMVGAWSVPFLIAALTALACRVFKRPTVRHTFVVTWAVLEALTLAIGVNNYYARQSRDEALRTATAHLAAALDHTQHPSAATIAPAPMQDAHSLASVMEQMAVLYRNESEHTEAVQKRIAAMPLGTVISPETLTSREGIFKSRKMLQDFSEILNGIEKQQATLSEKTSALLDTLEPSQRAAARSTYEPARAKVLAATGRYIAIEREGIVRFSSVLNFAEQHMGQIRQQGKLLVMPGEILPEYSALLANVVATAKEEEAAYAEIHSLKDQSRKSIADLQNQQ